MTRTTVAKIIRAGSRTAVDAATAVLAYGAYTLRGDRRRRTVVAVDELIKVQNELAKLPIYWRVLESQADTTRQAVRTYIKSHRLDVLALRAQSAGTRIDAVLKTHAEEFRQYEELSKRLVWVMSTGRCGIDALDQFLKTSPDLFSIHREFRGEKIYEFGSAVTTKSRVFNLMLVDAMSEADILETTRTYVETRLRTIARAGTRTFVLCEHHDEAWLPIILRVFPRSRIIHLWRRPEAVIQSYLLKGLFSGRQVTPLDVTGSGRLHFVNLFAQLCWFDALINTYIDLHLRSIDDSRKLRVRSEDLFRADTGTFEKLGQFLDAHLDHDAFVRIMSVPQNTKSGGENAFPRDWPPGLQSIYDEFAAAYLSHLGMTI